MYVKVRVIASARKEKIEKKSEDHYIVYVKEKAQMNLANNRVCEIMASLLKVPRKSIRIINGHQNPSKILSINVS